MIVSEKHAKRTTLVTLESKQFRKKMKEEKYPWQNNTYIKPVSCKEFEIWNYLLKLKHVFKNLKFLTETFKTCFQNTFYSCMIPLHPKENETNFD